MPLVTVVDERTRPGEQDFGPLTWLLDIFCVSYRGPISDFALMPDEPEPSRRTEAEDRRVHAAKRAAARPTRHVWEPAAPSHWK